ncbi:hypothetical protein [Alteromonas macleodii]|uniref:hypothetical protein n=1 Tax=Alteromonas macleodii TaxID=28108 RepID=UPI0012D2CD40|nr:hypothetical protein [Alteromonas macleodii]
MNPYQNEPLIPNAWIYIAIDIRDLSICKIGLTTAVSPWQRIQQGTTSNPFYLLFNSYNLSIVGISKKELQDLERYLHRKIERRIPIVSSGSVSEWVESHPLQAENWIDSYISNSFELNGFSLQNEHGEVNYSLFNKVKEVCRPDPSSITRAVRYEQCQEYVDYLIWYHNSARLGQPNKPL